MGLCLPELAGLVTKRADPGRVNNTQLRFPAVEAGRPGAGRPGLLSPDAAMPARVLAGSSAHVCVSVGS